MTFKHTPQVILIYGSHIIVELKIHTIQVNQQNINISNGLSIESRKRVADTVKNILDKYKSQEIVEEYKEVKED